MPLCQLSTSSCWSKVTLLSPVYTSSVGHPLKALWSYKLDLTCLMFPVSNHDPILLVVAIEYHLQHLHSYSDSKTTERNKWEVWKKWVSEWCICFCTGGPESVCGAGGYLMLSFQLPFGLKKICNSISPAVPMWIITLVISKLSCTVTTSKTKQWG